jgi:hypothetical protein
LVANNDQKDTDGDGIGNVCDTSPGLEESGDGCTLNPVATTGSTSALWMMLIAAGALIGARKRKK